MAVAAMNGILTRNLIETFERLFERTPLPNSLHSLPVKELVCANYRQILQPGLRYQQLVKGIFVGALTEPAGNA
jgi:hypothetical protein